MLNTKKMHVDMKAIMDAIDGGVRKSEKGLVETVSMGIRSFPIMAGFRIGTLLVPMEDVGDKEVIKEIEERSKLCKKAGFSDSYLSKSGIYTKDIEIDIDIVYGKTDFSKGYTENFKKDSSNWIELANSSNNYMITMKDICDETAEFETYAKDFLNKYFGKNWGLVLISNAKIKEYIIDNKDIIFKAIKEVIAKAELDIKIGKYPELYVKYERFSDVVALNIIKIIKKGTDNLNTLYTGECIGMTLETLVSSKQSAREDVNSTLLLKTFIKHDKTASNIIHSGQNDVFEEDVVNLAKINNIIASDYAARQIIKLDTIDTMDDKISIVHYSWIGDSIWDEHDDEITRVNHNKYSIGFVMNTVRTADSFMITDNQLIHLVIPYGTDLSNSFKAKYI